MNGDLKTLAALTRKRDRLRAKWAELDQQIGEVEQQMRDAMAALVSLGKLPGEPKS